MFDFLYLKLRSAGCPKGNYIAERRICRGRAKWEKQGVREPEDEKGDPRNRCREDTSYRVGVVRVEFQNSRFFTGPYPFSRKAVKL